LELAIAWEYRVEFRERHFVNSGRNINSEKPREPCYAVEINCDALVGCGCGDRGHNFVNSWNNDDLAI
jgi:hypothetical protein